MYEPCNNFFGSKKCNTTFRQTKTVRLVQVQFHGFRSLPFLSDELSWYCFSKEVLETFNGSSFHLALTYKMVIFHLLVNPYIFAQSLVKKNFKRFFKYKIMLEKIFLKKNKTEKIELQMQIFVIFKLCRMQIFNLTSKITL